MTAKPTNLPVRTDGAATAARRGKTLLAQGYTIRPTERAYTYFVERPRPVRDVTGDEVRGYWVCIAPGQESCDCAYFGREGHRFACKHLVAVRRFVRGIAAYLSPVVDLGAVLGSLNLEETL